MGMRLSQKLLLWIISFMAAGMGLMTVYVIFHSRTLITDMGMTDAKRSAGMVFEALYASMSTGGGREGNRAIVERLSQLQDLGGVRVIHGPSINMQYGIEEDELPRDDLDRAALAGLEISQVERGLDGEGGVRFVKPVFAVEACKRCHFVDEGDVLGAISITTSLKRYDRQLAASARQITIMGIGILAGTIALSVLFIMRVIIRPVREFQEAARAIGEGGLASVIKPSSSLEMNVLADEFNRMNSSLKAISRELEKKVEERTRELEREVEVRKRSEDAVKHMAYHDALTGLPNRLVLIDRVSQVLARGRWHGRIAAIIYLDLDRFKVINDTLGHHAGDELLKEVALRLVKCVRSGDTVVRQGGDEFIMLLQDINRIEDITTVVQKVFSAFDSHFMLAGREFGITASLGISIYPDDGEDVETLFKNADIAMYQAKEEGGNKHKFYTAAMNEKFLQRLDFERRMRRALENDEFILYYQPEVDIDTGEVSGVEALIRWRDPELGLLMPGDFIPLAEDTGLIIPIGEWALRAACAQNREWQERGLRPVIMAVNLSMRQFRENDFMGSLMRVLEETGLDPKWLELELTESIIMDNAESVIGTLRELKSMGVRLTIDDFGTGYSSLEYLKRMPINKLKIAQSFIKGITTDPDDVAIANTVISIGHSMKMEVLAEGVETVEQLLLLRTLKCDKVQGFLMSRPVPAGQAESLLEKGAVKGPLWSGV
ncbi:EAL domain-containing protein [bacterium]|nr:EAL domain-containing protein [bacterium]